jgi:hypothetical protein
MLTVMPRTIRFVGRCLRQHTVFLVPPQSSWHLPVPQCARVSLQLSVSAQLSGVTFATTAALQLSRQIRLASPGILIPSGSLPCTHSVAEQFVQQRLVTQQHKHVATPPTYHCPLMQGKRLSCCEVSGSLNDVAAACSVYYTVSNSTRYPSSPT